MQIEGHNEAHYGQDGEVHDTGNAEEEARQTVVDAGNVSAEPVVAPGRGHGQGIHGDGRAEIRHRQVHAEQLRRLHTGRPSERHDEDEQVSHSGEHGWGKRETETDVWSLSDSKLLVG